MQIAKPAGEMGTQRGNSSDKCAGNRAGEGGGRGREHSSGSFFCLLLVDLLGLLSTKKTL